MTDRNICKWCGEESSDWIANHHHERRCIWHEVNQGDYQDGSKTFPIDEEAKQVRPKEALGDLLIRSYTTNEFAIAQNGFHDDFLAVTLQTLWMFPEFKVSFLSFCLEKVGPNPYPALVSAIQDFYLSIT